MRWARIIEGAATTRCPVVAPARGPTILLLLGVAACSSSPPPPVPPAPSRAPITTPTPEKKTDVRSRLQGTWELTTFVSRDPLPDDTAPAIDRLRGAVRLRFEEDRITTFIPGASDEETCLFEIEGEIGASFTLITSLGMFRRARARFISDDAWEATENGPLWPGTTTFTRVPARP